MPDLDLKGVSREKILWTILFDGWPNAISHLELVVEAAEEVAVAGNNINVSQESLNSAKNFCALARKLQEETGDGPKD